MPALLLPLLLVASLIASGPDDVVRMVSQQFDAHELRSVALDFPVGEVEISARPGDEIEVEIVLECNEGWRRARCEDRAEQIGLSSRVRDGQLQLDLQGYSTWRSGGLEIHLDMKLPPRLALAVDMGIGELQIRGLEADITVDMRIGEITVVMARERVGKVIADTSIGEATLRTPERRLSNSGLFTPELSWDNGPGQATIQIDLGIGEVEVRINE